MTLAGPVEPELSWTRACPVAAGRPPGSATARGSASAKPRSAAVGRWAEPTSSCGASRVTAASISWSVNRWSSRATWARSRQQASGPAGQQDRDERDRGRQAQCGRPAGAQAGGGQAVALLVDERAQGRPVERRAEVQALLVPGARQQQGVDPVVRGVGVRR
ncbi:hypothetical protein ACPC54_20000 [Kitasatospora sp. NPDC094028]